MSNMSYCRFENTIGDLRDCVEAIEEGKPLSEREARFAKKMVQVCKDYLAAVKDNGIVAEDEDEESDDEYDDTDPHDFMGR